MEKWKDIIGYEGSYQISDRGRVKSLARKHRLNTIILKPHFSRGMHKVSLTPDTARKKYVNNTMSVAKLVAIHFLEGFEDYMDKTLMCYFKDGDNTNLWDSNIEARGVSAHGKSFNDISVEDRHRVQRAFWRTSLRRGEKVVDNSTTTIARKLGLKRSSVDSYISYMLDLKYENFKK